jgi:hypothetical protein
MADPDRDKSTSSVCGRSDRVSPARAGDTAADGTDRSSPHVTATARHPAVMGRDPHEFVQSERIGIETSLPCATSVLLHGRSGAGRCGPGRAPGSRTRRSVASVPGRVPLLSQQDSTECDTAHDGTGARRATVWKTPPMAEATPTPTSSRPPGPFTGKLGYVDPEFRSS